MAYGGLKKGHQNPSTSPFIHEPHQGYGFPGFGSLMQRMGVILARGRTQCSIKCESGKVGSTSHYTWYIASCTLFVKGVN